MSTAKDAGNLSNLLRRNRFYILLVSDTISSIGDWLSLIALMILCYDKTSSPLGVSGILIVRALPTLFLSFHAGVLADRWNRKKIMVTTNILRGLAIFVLVFTSNPLVLYAVSFGVAALGTFFNPAVDATLPDLVGQNRIVKANALMNAEKMLAMVAGPALAALCIQHFGFHTTFLLDAVSFLLFGALILFIPVLPPATIKERGRLFILKDIVSGVQLVLANKTLLIVLLSSGLAYCTMGALGTLELVFCSKILKVDTHVYGQIVAIAGGGAVVGSIACGWFRQRSSLGLFLLGLFLFGLGISLFSFQTVVWMTVPFLVIEGVGESLFTIGGRSYLQYRVPSDTLGKTMSHRLLMEKLGMILGMLLAGLFAAAWDVRFVLLMFGVVLTLVTMGLVVFTIISSNTTKCLNLARLER